MCNGPHVPQRDRARGSAAIPKELGSAVIDRVKGTLSESTEITVPDGVLLGVAAHRGQRAVPSDEQQKRIKTALTRTASPSACPNTDTGHAPGSG